MEISEKELEEKLEELLPKKLKELGLFYSDKDLATKTEIKELIAAMERRFESSDKRFEDMNKRFEAIILEVKSISAGLGTLGNRTGNEFEELMRSLFSSKLTDRGIDSKKVEKLGLKNSDPSILNGLEKITYDGYFHNGKEILMEIKFSMDLSKITWFYQRCKAFEKLKGYLPEMWVLVVHIDPFAREFAAEHDIEVITRHGEDIKYRYDS